MCIRDRCNKSFSRSCKLQSHKRHVHSNRRPYQCPFCGKMFKRNIDVKSHVRIHTDTKPYSCRHCSDRFMWSKQLKQHLLESHNEGTWLICNICQKKFSHNGKLVTHVRQHKGVKPYVCSECPKRFFTAGELKRHELIHSDVKRFGCILCDKSFKHKRSVVKHFNRCASKMSFSDMLPIC